MKRISGRTARIAATTLGSAAVMALGAGSASATTILGDGAPLAAGTSISAPLAGGLYWVTASGTATCSGGQLAGTIGANPASPSVPFSLTGFSAGAAVAGGSCTDNIAFWNVTSFQLVSAGGGSISSMSTGGYLSVQNPLLKLNFTAGGLPGNCTYQVNNRTQTAAATVQNSDHSVTLNSVPLKTTATAGTCTVFNGSSLSGTFKPLQAGSALVTVG